MTFRETTNYKFFKETELCKKKGKDIHDFLRRCEEDFSELFRSDLRRKEYYTHLLLQNKKEHVKIYFENHFRVRGALSWIYTYFYRKYVRNRK